MASTSGSELRWQTIGMVGDVVVLVVAHTVREQGEDEIIRILCAKRRNGRNAKAMTKTVRKTLSDRPMTAVQKRRLDKLAQQDRLFRYSGTDREVLAERHAQPVLSSSEEASHPAHRR